MTNHDVPPHVIIAPTPHVAEKRGSLSEFVKVLSSLKSVWSWIAKVAVFGPFADLLIGVGPKWPEHKAVPVITAIGIVVTLMLVFQRGLRSGDVPATITEKLRTNA